jgi:hypothetical protein
MTVGRRNIHFDWAELFGKGQSFYLKMDTHQVSETLCFLVIWKSPQRQWFYGVNSYTEILPDGSESDTGSGRPHSAHAQ